jgi:hypothetical protein
MCRSTQESVPFFSFQDIVYPTAPEVDPPLLRHLYPSAQQDAVLSVRESIPLCYSTCTQAQDAVSVQNLQPSAQDAVPFSS